MIYAGPRLYSVLIEISAGQMSRFSVRFKLLIRLLSSSLCQTTSMKSCTESSSFRPHLDNGFILASGPGDPLCSGVPDVLLEKAILSAGATEIDFKVRNTFTNRLKKLTFWSLVFRYSLLTLDSSPFQFSVCGYSKLFLRVPDSWNLGHSVRRRCFHCNHDCWN